MVWSTPRTWATSEVVTAAHMNQEVRDNLNAVVPNAVTTVDWDPSLEAVTTNPSVTVDGARYQVGGLEFLWARFEFSAIATPQGSGIYFVTLPNNATNIGASTTGGSGQVVGTWQGRDDSAAAAAHGNVLLRSASTIQFNTTGTGLVNDAAPFSPSWAGSDVLSFHAVIPIA